MERPNHQYDAILVGAGIMSSTLAIILNELSPGLRLLIVERLNGPALESSAAQNNAGTGHAANCELNYTPRNEQGNIQVEKAIAINRSFERSLELWASLTEMKNLDPRRFLNQLPHISFVSGTNDVAFLTERHQLLSSALAFKNMRLTKDRSELKEWMPLVMENRGSDELVAATRIDRGLDVDFGELTKSYLKIINQGGLMTTLYGVEVVNIRRFGIKGWELDLQGNERSYQVRSPFVFVGAGGGALPLLQKSGIPEASGYGGFPISGQWLVCKNKSILVRHNAKVYGKAKVGSPPMAVPHLDSRWINGRRSLMFGPYAGFSSKFLKKGSSLDLFRSLRRDNFSSMIEVGIKNLNLVNYLISEVIQSEDERLVALKQFMPNASPKDWDLVIAGQRVQIIKSTSDGAVLKMGTEVVSSSDGSIAALLGASPGASTAVTIMLEVLERCWSEQMKSRTWRAKLKSLFPSYGNNDFNQDSSLLKMRERNDYLLGLKS